MDNDLKNKEEKKSVFRNKNFALLFQGRFASSLAATFYSFFLSFYILKITDSNALIQGIYLAVCGFTFVIFSVFGGVLADRWNKVKIIYFSDFIKGIAILLALIPLIIGINNDNSLIQVITLFIVGFINNLIASIFEPASMALIPEIIEENQLQEANSFFTASSNFISILGLILAGVLYSLIPIIPIFLIVGCLYILSGISELFIKALYKKDKNNLDVKSIMKDFIIGVKYVYHLKPIFYVIIGCLFLNFFTGPLFSNLFPYLIETEIADKDYMFKSFIKPELWDAIISLAVCIGSIAASIFISKRPQKDHNGKSIKIWLLIFTITIFMAGVTYFSFINSNINVFLIITCSLALAWGISLPGINIPITVAIQKEVEQDKLAKVSSVLSIGSQGLIPFASLLGGIILNGLGSGALIISCGIGLLLVSIFIGLSKEISKI